MKKKNKLKSMVDYCFICGQYLSRLEDKIGHRINPKKGNTKNNLLIVCSKCKKLLQKTSIENLIPNNSTIDKYFKELGIDCKKIILRKLCNLRLLNRNNYRQAILKSIRLFY